MVLACEGSRQLVQKSVLLPEDELMMSIMPPECGKMLECMRGYAKENRPSLHVLASWPKIVAHESSGKLEPAMPSKSSVDILFGFGGSAFIPGFFGVHMASKEEDEIRQHKEARRKDLQSWKVLSRVCVCVCVCSQDGPVFETIPAKGNHWVSTCPKHPS